MDATAYAYRLMLDVFGVDVEELIFQDAKVIEAVKAKAEKMLPTYSEELKYIGELFKHK